MISNELDFHLDPPKDRAPHNVVLIRWPRVVVLLALGKTSLTFVPMSKGWVSDATN